MGNLAGYIAAAVTVIWFIGIFVWLYRRKYGPTVEVRATVVSKQVTEFYSKYSANAKLCYVTFQIGNKRKSFKISEFSYNGYRKGQNGTLKYRGSRLIDFR